MRYLKTLLLIITLISCSNEKTFCDKNFIQPPKTITIDLNKAEKNVLSDLTSILNGYNGQSIILENNMMYSNITHEVFYKITDKVQNLYIVSSRYTSESTDGSVELFLDRTNNKFLNRKLLIEIPINELNVKRLSKYTGDLKGGKHYMNIDISSQFNNSPFKVKTIYYKNNKPTGDNSCGNINNFTISLDNEEQGKELYNYFINFIDVYNK